MSRIVIAPASVTSLRALRQLFVQAVDRHFDYFPVAVQRRVVRDHSLPQLLKATLDPRRVILTAKADGKLIGYAIGAAPTNGPAQLFWLYVDPEFRGSNTGLSLLSRMLKVLAGKGAGEVSIATYDHRSYYERQGFQYVETTIVNGVQMDIMTFKLPKVSAK